MKLLALDLDGTVVTHEGTITPAVRGALAECLRAQIPVVAVTGRPMRGMRVLHDVLPEGTQAICSNGAIVVDVHSMSPVAAKTFSPEVVSEQSQILAGRWPNATFGYDGLNGLTVWRDQESWPYGHHYLVDSPDGLEGVVKIFVHVPDADVDELCSQVQGIVGESGMCSHSATEAVMAEIAPRGVHKASALAEFAAGLGIDAEDVVAFGDMPNDLEMLQWAGRGYAMGNAHPDVLAATEYHAPSIDDDGVAVVVRELLG